MSELPPSVNLNVGAEQVGDRKDDYFDVVVGAVEDDGVRERLLELTREERRLLGDALDREGASFGNFKYCDDPDTICATLAKWRAGQAEEKKKAIKELVELLA